MQEAGGKYSELKCCLAMAVVVVVVSGMRN